MVRRRTTTMCLMATGLVALLSGACSVLFSTSKEQCATDDDCRARGVGFETSRCSLESVCVGTTSGSDSSTQGDTSASDGGDGAADPFACAKLPSENPDQSRQVEMSIRYTDFSSGVPPTQMAVRVCSATDPQCNNPRTTSTGGGPADAGPDSGTGWVSPTTAGIVTAKVEFGFEGFFEVRNSVYAPTYRYTSPPLRNPKNEFDQIILRPSEIDYLSDLALGKTGSYDSVGHGLVFLLANDCNRGPLAGVHFKLDDAVIDPLTVAFYIINTSPSKEATKTDGLGRGGFVNVAPGLHTFTAEFDDTKKRIGSSRIFVRAGSATTVAVLPSP